MPRWQLLARARARALSLALSLSLSLSRSLLFSGIRTLFDRVAAALLSTICERYMI